MSYIIEERKIKTNDESIYLHLDYADKEGYGITLTGEDVPGGDLFDIQTFELGQDHFMLAMRWFDYLAKGIEERGERFLDEINTIDCQAPMFNDINIITLLTLESYKDETVYRLTEEDFLVVIEDKFPGLSEDVIEDLIHASRDDFELYDWMLEVEAFLEARLDRIKEQDL